MKDHLKFLIKIPYPITRKIIYEFLYPSFFYRIISFLGIQIQNLEIYQFATAITIQIKKNSLTENIPLIQKILFYRLKKQIIFSILRYFQLIPRYRIFTFLMNIKKILILQKIKTTSLWNFRFDSSHPDKIQLPFFIHLHNYSLSSIENFFPPIVLYYGFLLVNPLIRGFYINLNSIPLYIRSSSLPNIKIRKSYHISRLFFPGNPYFPASTCNLIITAQQRVYIYTIRLHFFTNRIYTSIENPNHIFVPVRSVSLSLQKKIPIEDILIKDILLESL